MSAAASVWLSPTGTLTIGLSGARCGAAAFDALAVVGAAAAVGALVGLVGVAGAQLDNRQQTASPSSARTSVVMLPPDEFERCGPPPTTARLRRSAYAA